MARNPYQHGQLRQARKAIRLTQAGVAERLAELAWHREHRRVGVNADMVAKWERGDKAPIPTYQELLCLLFDATPTELGIAEADPVANGSIPRMIAEPSDVPWAQILLVLDAPGRLLHRHLVEEWENDLLKRRELLRSVGLTAMAAGLGALPPPIPRVMARHDLQPDADTLSGLRELADSYQRLYHDTAPQILMTPIRAHLRTVEELLRLGCAARERRVLLGNQSQVALLAGRLSFFDLHDPLAARGYLILAYESAVAADDTPLAAAALGHLAFVPADSGAWSAAADHLNRASAYAQRGGAAPLRSWLAAAMSEIRTNAGDHKGALTAIDEAKRQAESASDAPRPAWFDYYDASRLHGFEGYALMRCGSMSASATRVLERALVELDRSAIKQRTIFLTDLATANIHQGNVDEACDLAIQAATDARTGQYATSVARLREFRSSLHRYDTSRAVRDLDRAMVEL